MGWLLKLETGHIPSLEDMPSLCATVSKAGDIFYLPPGIVLVDKTVNDHSVCLSMPELLAFCALGTLTLETEFDVC